MTFWLATPGSTSARPPETRTPATRNHFAVPTPNDPSSSGRRVVRKKQSRRYSLLQRLLRFDARPRPTPMRAKVLGERPAGTTVNLAAHRSAADPLGSLFPEMSEAEADQKMKERTTAPTTIVQASASVSRRVPTSRSRCSAARPVDSEGLPNCRCSPGGGVRRPCAKQDGVFCGKCCNTMWRRSANSCHLPTCRQRKPFLGNRASASWEVHR